MLIYKATKEQFIKDVLTNRIEEKIELEYELKFGKANSAIIRSWRNSMNFINNVIIQSSVPSDASVAIEYQVPNTSKRIDFILAGRNADNRDSVIIVELKQWDLAYKTKKDGIVETYIGNGIREVVHPSHQAFTYARLLYEYNETVRKEDIQINACAYLHNYKRGTGYNAIIDSWYQEYLDHAPSFLSEDSDKLIDFLNKYIKYGDNKDILYRIDNGRIKPSKALADSVSLMLRGNEVFYLVDDQKVVFEFISDVVKNNPSREKRTIIVKGGPGTGKSVISINLLSDFLSNELNVQYTTRNSAPRAVYSALLKQDYKNSFIDNLFKGSGAYFKTETNYFDVLICDEAHRLSEKSGFMNNLGEHQIKEIINASIVNVFFIDEDQIVTLNDIGSVDLIQKCAKKMRSSIYELELTSQFRCNGSNGYIAWLDNLLQIRDTANQYFNKEEFDFQIIDDPNVLRDLIIEKNELNNKSRVLAGYCWEWPTATKNDPNYHDIVIPEFNFGMSWNLLEDGQAFLIKPNSVHQAGCIHTAQGLELDYVGVIIGKDITYRDGKVLTHVEQRANSDLSVKGWKTAKKNNDATTMDKVDRIIRNTYRTLLTRGMKGCYVFIQDKQLKEYFHNHIK